MRPRETDPEVRRIIDEMDALNATLQATSGTIEVARLRVRAVEAVQGNPTTVEDFLLRAAMARITGKTLPGGTPQLSHEAPWSMRAFELAGLAWLEWDQSNVESSRRFLGQWAEENHGKATVYGRGAVQAYTVSLWITAILALLDDSKHESRRIYRRIQDMGSSFGTESHPAILWTMAASFIPGG